MSIFPNSPKLLNGGIGLVDLHSGWVNKGTLLQYKSDAVTRTQIAQPVHTIFGQ